MLSQTYFRFFLNFNSSCLSLTKIQESRKEESKVTENTKAVVVPRAGGGDSGGDEKLAAKPNLAKFPTSNGSVNPTPLEFEAEQPSGRTSNPVVLWQVYALGGFLVLKWALARWKEMKEWKGKKESPDDNEPPAPDDEGSNS